MGDIPNQTRPSLFVAVYENNEQIEGGNSYFDTKWLSLPLKQIKSLFYKLPSGDYLTFSGYNKYFNMVEALQDFTGTERGQVKLQYVYIMAQKENKVISYRVSLLQQKNDRYQEGDITVRTFDKNDKFILGLNAEGWR